MRSAPVASAGRRTNAARPTESSNEAGAASRRTNSYMTIPSEDYQCTQLIHTIFDRSVGNGFGGYPCTYSRQHGRLYVARNAVLFYSNLFGYERRLCMMLSEVIEAKIHRSTSIWITMMDGEDFVFKSLQADRDRIVALIRALLHAQAPSEAAAAVFPNPPIRQVELDGVGVPTVSGSSSTTSSEEHGNSMSMEVTTSAPLMRESRMRAQSCPSDMNQATSFDLKSIAEHDDNIGGVNTPLRERNQSNGEVSSIATSACTERVLEAWRTEKQTQQQRFPERAIDGLMLKNCSLSFFFDQFLADDAPHSIALYQENVIGDTQVEVTKWVIQDNTDDAGGTTGTMTRTISFCHPIGNNFGVGPSSTMANRKQTLHRYGDFGLCMETSTHVEGIPACDAFYVADRWLVEEEHEEGNEASPQIQFTVLHDTVFTKRTMFKRMIESSTKTEIKSWYKGYVTLLLRQTQSGQPTSKASTVTPAELSATVNADRSEVRRGSSLWMLLMPFILIALAAVLVQNYFFQKQVENLQSQVVAMRAEQARMMQLFQAAFIEKEATQESILNL